MFIELLPTPQRSRRFVEISLDCGYVVAMLHGHWNDGWAFPAECLWVSAGAFEGDGG